MIARAEMSTNAQSTEPQSGSPKAMAVALIGPNDTHRQIVARALASAQGRKVHEFIDYPASLTDLARMMETKFDVVLVDVDTDESYALQIITKLAELGPAVMAYSARTDEDLLKSCMRAGARDFLPLPTENSAAPEPMRTIAPPVAVVPEPLPRPVAQPTPRPIDPPRSIEPPRPIDPRPAVPAPPVSRSNVMPITPERVIETNHIPELPPASEVETVIEDQDPLPEVDILKSDDKDFAAWDAVNLRRASMPSVPKPESRPRPSLVSDKRKSEPAPKVVPTIEEPVVAESAPPAPLSPPVDRPPVPVDIFRSSQFLSEYGEVAEKQSAKWVKWILIAAGPVVLALVLLVVFTRNNSTYNFGGSTKTPAAQSSSTALAQAQAPAAEDAAASDRLIVNATGKSDNLRTAAPKPGPGQQGADPLAGPPRPAAQVSPDAMAAQLVAPTRIATQIKKAASDAPPTAPAAVSLDDNNSVPGSVFGSGSKAKIEPHLVPISAGLAAGMLIHKTQPLYPKFAQDAHITGTVMLKATITKQGSIEGIQVLSGPKILAPSAVDAVKTWRYRPYLLDGQPVAVETTITVVFGGTGK